MSASDELLTIEQAAEFLKVSEASLRRWTNSGRLACLRVGRRRERRFRRVDLLAFMEDQPAAGTPEEGSAATPSRQESVRGQPELRPGGHLCGVFASDAGRTKLAAAFLAEGLHAGSRCYLVAPPSVRKAILTGLKRSHPSLRTAIDAGHLVLSEYAASPRLQWKYWETQFSKAEQAGVPSLRVVGDVWGIARSVSPEALVEYEAGYDRIQRRFRVATLCQYDARRFSGVAILDALRGHQDIFGHPIDRLLA